MLIKDTALSEESMAIGISFGAGKLIWEGMTLKALSFSVSPDSFVLGRRTFVQNAVGQNYNEK